MKHKVLVLFFLGWIFYTFPVLKAESQRMQRYLPKLAADSILSGKQDERIIQMKKLYQTVPADTSAKNAVLPDPHFREKYLSDADFNYNHNEGSKSFLDRLFEKIGLLLNKLFGAGTINKYSDLTEFAFFILCLLVVLAAIYLVVRILMKHKGVWFFKKKIESIVIDIHNTEQLIQSADFEQLISEIEMQGDTRQGIRLYYLWLLKDLKENELINWLPEKTNSDYLFELKEEKLKKKFSYLSYLYNYIWYGEFSIGDEDYIIARKAFLNYLKGERQHG